LIIFEIVNGFLVAWH